MHSFSIGVALLAALGIIWIGGRYLFSPMTMAPSFGLPLPGDDTIVASWLRLKGVRDVTSGLLILAFMTLGKDQALGVVLLVEALIPFGDMSVVLAGGGKTSSALGIHGVTAAVMALAAIPLITGGS